MAQTATVFAPETISTGNVFKGTFSMDGNTFYFFKNVTPGEEDFRIFRSKKTATASWSEPEKILLGGDFSELYPVISPDGKTLVFASYRPAADTIAYPENAYLWKAQLDKSGNWGTPTFMNTVNISNHYHSNPAFDVDGNIVFRTDNSDWTVNTTWVATKQGGKFENPIKYEPVEQWKNWKENMFLWGGVPGPDNDTVILDVSPIDPTTRRRGKSDQYVSYKKLDETWTVPKPLLGGVNNPDVYDTFVFFSRDYKTLYFVREFGKIYSLLTDTALNPEN